MVFCYNDYVSYEKRDKLFSDFKNILITGVTNKLKAKNCFFIFDEGVSNIIDYYSLNHIRKTCNLMVNSSSDKIEFEFSNFILVKDKKSIAEYIDHVNSSEDALLKRRIKMNLENCNANKKNAGIGLMLIKVKIREGIKYEFVNFDDKYAEVKINIKLRL